MDYRQQLLGSWSLQQWELHYTETGKVVLPYGECPVGLLQYTGDGWMSAAISRRERATLPAGQAPRDLPSELLAAAFLSYFQYAGRFTVEGDAVTHHVTQALNPNMMGTEQVRYMRFDGDSLWLRGIEQTGARERTHLLHWRRNVIR